LAASKALRRISTLRRFLVLAQQLVENGASKERRGKAFIPAAKFHKPSIVWKSSDNLACVCLEGLNLGIGEVILVQVSDVLKQF
jgi:hypothetical protein